MTAGQGAIAGPAVLEDRWPGLSLLLSPDGKVVRQTDYFANPFEAPAWRSASSASTGDLDLFGRLELLDEIIGLDSTS